MIFLPPAEFAVALENIIDNSLDAMEEKGGVLRLTTFLEDNFCNLVVSDTGIGIAKADLVRIFEPFYSTKDVGKGTGLGLSICYRMVNGMGGEIRLKARKAKGPRFSFASLFLRINDQARRGVSLGPFSSECETYGNLEN